MASTRNLVNTKVGGQVRMTREACGFSDEQVAAKLGVSIDEYKELEEGSKRFSAGQLRELSSLMKVNVVTFFNTLNFDRSAEARAEAHVTGLFNALY